MEHGVVAERLRCRRYGTLQQGIDLGHAEDLGQTLADFWGIDFSQRVGVDCPLLYQKVEKGAQGRQSPGIGAGTDVTTVAELEVALDLLAAHLFQVTVVKAEKGAQVSPVGGNGIGRQASLDGEMLQKALQQVGRVGLLGQGVEKRKKKNPGMYRGFFYSTAIFHPIELAKFTQGFRSFATFLDAGFFVILTPFQLAFDTVDLQFFLQLPDRVFKVTSDIYFDHIASLPLVVGRGH